MTKQKILAIAKPILFNTEMVRALMDNRKTVTRRVVKPQPLFKTHSKYVFADDVCPEKWQDCDDIIATYRYQPSDYLYVRETWQPEVEHGWLYNYKADDDGLCCGKWRPSIHMPKEAARLFLRVTDVRVERLQDITNDDCHKEGINESGSANFGSHYNPQKYDFSIEKYNTLWDSTIKKKDLDRCGWSANPWVWVIEFERVEVSA